MVDYTVNLTPNLITEGTEGSLDTSVSGGVSYQRTISMLLVPNESDGTQLKVVGTVKDGVSFNDSISGISDVDFVI